MSGDGGLTAQVTLRRGTFTLDVEIAVDRGHTLAVLGPNGSGKSTLLALIAGLLRLDRGTIVWAGRPMTTAPGRFVPPAARRIGLLGQDPLLFPHLSVEHNVAFGARARGVTDPAGAASRWLDRLGVAKLAARRPRELSGGQAARVALARALAAEPDVLLLDEPLAALDAEAAPLLRQLLAETLRDEALTTVLVSHDVLDAALLADQVAVLHEGSVVESGSRAEVLGAPKTAFTAAFVGVNLVPAGYLGLAPEGSNLRFRPSVVQVSPTKDWTENAWEATVRWLEPATGGVRVRLYRPDQPGLADVLVDLDPVALNSDWLHPGARIWAHVPAAAVHVA